MSENLQYEGTESAVEEPEGSTDAAPEADASTAVVAEAIESESPSDATADAEQEPVAEGVYYDIEGEEVSLDDIKQWKSGHLMQSDYTKKTQALADERKDIDSKRQVLGDKLTMLSEIETELESVVLGDLAEVDLDQLMRDNPSEYLRVTKAREDKAKTLSTLAAKRKDALNALHAENYQSLHTKLGWDDDIKRTGDLKLITAQAKREGVSEQDFSTFLHPAIMTAMRKAELYDQLQESKPEVNKRVLKTPKTSRVSGKSTSKPAKSLAERMYGKP